MLVYGPSARGALRRLADQLGAQTLNDFLKPVELTWADFSLHTLDMAAASGEAIIFDLTFLEDLSDVLDGTGRFAQAITAIELRYLRRHWSRFEPIVRFYANDQERNPPW